MREIVFRIAPTQTGITVRDFLRDFGVSSSLLKKLKKNERSILVNGAPVHTTHRLWSSDVLSIAIFSDGSMPEAHFNDDVEFIYGDEDVLVVNKPPLMPVHESLNHQGDTLSNACAFYMNRNAAFRAVYRLDRDTSGLVVIAKHELAASKLAGNIQKDYYAVVHGKAAGSGSIELPIKRERDSIIKRIVSPDGENAITEWQTVKSDGEHTLLKVNLQTGKTHQIRIHFSHLGFPVEGDTMYGGNCDCISRQALHCKDIHFVHPVTGNKMSFTCDFPSDMTEAFKGLI